MKYDSSNSKTILIARNPIPLKEISISFQKSLGFTFGIGSASQWSFRSVIILDMQSNIRYSINTRLKLDLHFFLFFLYSYKFCPPSSSSSTIKSGSYLTYHLCV